jgi:hypothetical protein
VDYDCALFYLDEMRGYYKILLNRRLEREKGQRERIKMPIQNGILNKKQLFL